jgi:hypothetical protein
MWYYNDYKLHKYRRQERHSSVMILDIRHNFIENEKREKLRRILFHFTNIHTS